MSLNSFAPPTPTVSEITAVNKYLHCFGEPMAWKEEEFEVFSLFSA